MELGSRERIGHSTGCLTVTAVAQVVVKDDAVRLQILPLFFHACIISLTCTTLPWLQLSRWHVKLSLRLLERMNSIVIVQVRLTIILALQVVQLVFGTASIVARPVKSELLLQVRAEVVLGRLRMNDLWRLVGFAMTVVVHMLLRHVLDGLKPVKVREVVGTRVQAYVETIIEFTDYLVARFVILVKQVVAIYVSSTQRVVVGELHQLRLTLLRVMNLHVLVQSHMLLLCLVILTLHSGAMRGV